MDPFGPTWQSSTGTLRTMLARLGWRPAEARPQRLVRNGHPVVLQLLAERAGLRLFLCESDAGEPVPTHAERLSIRAELDSAGAAHVTLFTDAAHSVHVWSWIRHVGDGLMLYEEHSSRPGEPEPLLLRRLAEAAIPNGDWDPPCQEAGTHPSADPLLERLVAEVPQRDRWWPAEQFTAALHEGGGLRQWLQVRVAATSAPEQIRAFWRVLVRFRVLDARCGRGEWLLSCAEVLAPLYVACFARIEAWLQDHERAQGAAAARFADFEVLLHPLTRGGRFGSPEEYARSLVLRRNIFGVDPSPEAIRAARIRLIEWLDAGDGSGCELDLNLRAGSLDAGIDSEGALRSVLARGGRSPGAVDGYLEEVEIADRAEARVRDLDLLQRTPEQTRARTAAEIRRRRNLLSGALNRDTSRVREANGEWGHAPAVRPLHPYIEFREIMRAGGFQYVRDVE